MRYLFTLTFPLIAFATPALAKSEGESLISVSTEAAVVSDYRFRGVSFSNNKVAVQGGITLETKAGFYANAWSTNIEKDRGANTELDVTGGWSGPVGPFEVDVNIVGYLYPKGQSINYYEFTGSLSKDFGPINTTAGIAYSPKQANIGNIDNIYLFGDISYSLPATPFAVNCHVGYENGIYTHKYDLGAGASVHVKPFTLGLTYITVISDPTDELGKYARDTLLVSLKSNF